MAGGPLELWNHWSIQILVLLSLALQVVLFALARIRRREAYPVLRLLLWLAYQQADSTAIYALGLLLSLSSAAREDQLVAFWAPFLLLHLGGPDSISAYALQDTQLWRRHLQLFVVHVLGAAYVLYKHVAGNGSLVLLAAILMFAVGVAKYGERTWALRCSKMDNIRSSLKEQRAKHHHFYPLHQGRIREEEFHLRRAHSLVKSSGAKADDAADLVKAIRTLSNYMMFLLVDRPDMLPGLAQSRLYQRTLLMFPCER